MPDRVSLGDNGTLPGRSVAFRCPGCDDVHSVTIEHPDGWTWNGDMERPTFTPSVRVRAVQWPPDGPKANRRQNHPGVEPGQHTTCHSFVTDGRIQFLGDCTHMLAGQTVDLPEWQA
jgi:hypothetical protein